MLWDLFSVEISILTSEDDCSLEISAYFLGKMVNEASVKRKGAQIHNRLTS